MEKIDVESILNGRTAELANDLILKIKEGSIETEALIHYLYNLGDRVVEDIIVYTGTHGEPDVTLVINEAHLIAERRRAFIFLSEYNKREVADTMTIQDKMSLKQRIKELDLEGNDYFDVDAALRILDESTRAEVNTYSHQLLKRN